MRHFVRLGFYQSFTPIDASHRLKADKLTKEKTNYTAEANSTIRRWQKYREKDEQDFESAREGLYSFFEKAVQNDNVRRKVEAELREVRRGGGKLNIRNDSGYNLAKDDYDPIVDGGDFAETSWRDDE